MSQLRTRGRLSRLVTGLAATCALLLASGAASAAPNHMTVQGYLANTAGVPVTGDYTLVLSLYTSKTEPTAFWTESHTVTVVDGMFDAVLGADVGNPLTVGDFADNDQVWFGVTIIGGPGVPVGGDPELPRKQLASTGYAFSAGHADTADAASHATTADSATTAGTATAASTAGGLSCTNCVSVAMLAFDPATQAELQAALAALQIPSSVNGLSGGTISSAVTVNGQVKAASFALSNGTAVCTAAGNCGATLASLTCTAPNDLPVYDHNLHIWKCGAGTASGGVNASDLSCSGCVDVTELSFDPATQAELTAALAEYVKTTELGALVSDQELAAALAGYLKTADLNGYLTNYVTSSSLSTTLQSYVSTAALTSALATYVKSADLTAMLGDYVKTSTLTTTLAAYVKSADLTTALTAYVKASDLTSALSGYVKTSDMPAALAPYAKTADLAGYVSNSGLALVLANYTTTSGITSMLASYAKTADLAAYAKTSDLAAYAKLTDLPTSVNGLAGGTLTSGLAVTGQLSATTIKQNGNAVCDASGNCGTTLGAFNPATSCTTDQVLRWTGSAWACADANAGSVPEQPCTGTGKALQWNGTVWECVDARDLGLSKGQANGYELRDDWGDAWDGVARSARGWAAANQACIDDGARLPTVTEIWRNRASYGTGNIATANPNDAQYHWTISPSYRAGYHSIAYFSNNNYSDNTDATAYVFRCIWKSQKPAGFTGNRCFGPPGAECKSQDSFYNIDRWSRAPQFMPAARKECELENADLATAEDLEIGIMSTGTEFVSYGDRSWPFWHWTNSAGYYSNNYNYIRILQWTKNLEPWWSATAAWASHAGPSSVYQFRCVGKKSPTSGYKVSNPACNGSCFSITTASRNRLVADNADRTAAVWHTAAKACRALGASLPTAEEVSQLIPAGWDPAPTSPVRYLWTSSVATWGWQTYTWRSPASFLWNAHYEYSPTGDYRTGEYATPVTAKPYRCVWRETEAQNFLTCPVGQVQMRNEADGTYACVTSVAGNANGQQNPPNLSAFVDAWGNAWDTYERSAATYPTAKANCETRGGRLPVATELYRLRYLQGVVDYEMGQSGSATANYLWTLNPEYRENYQMQIRLSDGGATAVASNGAAVAAYRCVWPATRPEAFSGHACYGHPTAPCFETGRLRTDRYPRASVTQAAAMWECRFFGGRLMTVAEYAEFQHAGLPNSVNGKYEWSREWSYWSDGGTYIFTPARGTNTAQADWQFNSSLSEHNWYGYSSYLPFRCVFTDVMQ